MKVEIGESLMLSWLRHAKNCQVVQMNWKPSINSWELYNENALEYIMNETMKHFSGKFGLDVFKKNSSYSQLIQQGEIDVLGIEINKDGVQNLYAIDVAFHESGLNYGSKEETIARVTKKMIRTAMMIYGFFNLNKAEIIFATPKLYNSIGDTIQQCFTDLNEFFTSIQLDYKFTLICNEDFKDKIFNVVTAFSKSISDTSELFMRSIQMYNLFEEESKLKAIKIDKGIVKKELQPEIYNDFKGFEEMKIGGMVRSSMTRLIENDLLDLTEVDRLLQTEYSKRTFNLNYPVLKKYDPNNSLLLQRSDTNGRQRYYADPYIIRDNKYLLTNHWVEDLSRSYFSAWLYKMDNQDK